VVEHICQHGPCDDAIYQLLQLLVVGWALVQGWVLTKPSTEEGAAAAVCWVCNDTAAGLCLMAWSSNQRGCCLAVLGCAGRVASWGGHVLACAECSRPAGPVSCSPCPRWSARWQSSSSSTSRGTRLADESRKSCGVICRTRCTSSRMSLRSRPAM
jgi:hypothetical protein